MAITATIKIKNLDAILRAFKAAPKIMTSELSRAIKKSAFKIEGTSKRLTPVDTGRLRASHRTKFGVRQLSAMVSTNVDYAIFVHEGTSRVEARPFLSDAVEVEQRNIDKFFTQAVDNALNRIGRKA